MEKGVEDVRFPFRIASDFVVGSKVKNYNLCEVGSCKEIANRNKKGDSSPQCRGSLGREEPPGSFVQQQIHDILFNREIGWQEIIYDLINTEQLDPWDINITILTNKYLKKIEQFEEADFFVSSKVLLAAALLLRIKSEILLNTYIKSIDEILFGKKEKKKHILERIELDEEIPELFPRSPIPRYKKVTLKELISSLNKAITTENRRIQKEIIHHNALRETGISLPKIKINIHDKIKQLYENLQKYLEKNETKKKVSLTEFVGISKEEKLACFSPLLHLENNKKIWLEQERHFEEIHIWEQKTFIKHNGHPHKDLIETEDIDVRGHKKGEDI